MIRAAIAAAVFLVMATTPAAADPIFTPIFATVLTAVGLSTEFAVTIGATTFTISVAATLAALTKIAIGVALVLLTAPKPPKPTPEAGQVPVQQPLAYRIFGYGQCRLAGSFVYKENASAHLLQIMAVCGHKISEFLTIYLNDDPTEQFATGAAYPYLDGPLKGTVGAIDGNRYADGVVVVDTRLGENTETAYRFATFLDGTHWTVNHRGDKVASLMVACFQHSREYFATVYPYGAPLPSVVARLAPLYDPRDSGQDPNDESTFAYDNNVAMAILHYCCFSPFGLNKPYASAILPVLDLWLQAIDDCEDAMPKKAGGTEPRYRLGGWMTTEQDHNAPLQAMLSACDGHLVERGDGTLVLTVGKWREPEIILTDADILDAMIKTDGAGDARINKAVARYTSPDAGYTSVETDAKIDMADMALRGGPPRVGQLDLLWVQWVGQASRLLTYEMNRQALRVRGTLVLRLAAMEVAYQRWVKVRSNTLPFLSDVDIEVRKPRISLSEGTVTIDFTLSGAAVYEYDPATDESQAAFIPERPATALPPIPQNVAAVAQQIQQSEGYAIELRLSWDAATLLGNVRNDLNYEARWRLAPESGDVGAYSTVRLTEPTLSAGRWYANVGLVPADTALEVEVRSVAPNGYPSEWSDTQDVSTAIESVAPGAPTGLSGVPITGGADLEARAPNSANFAALQFYRGLNGDPFESASPVGDPIYGAPSQLLSYTDSVSAGNYDYFVVALNPQSVASTPAGPENVVVS